MCRCLIFKTAAPDTPKQVLGRRWHWGTLGTLPCPTSTEGLSRPSSVTPVSSSQGRAPARGGAVCARQRAPPLSPHPGGDSGVGKALDGGGMNQSSTAVLGNRQGEGV